VLGGITDASIDSLRRYDDNFLRYYPYLDRHIPWRDLRGKHVLEVGLGYGTVSQKLAENGAFFTGIDIAATPVAMVNHRLRQCGLAGEAIQGNILMPPFADGSFDAIVAIGCLHHTGNLGGSLSPSAQAWGALCWYGVLRLLISSDVERARADASPVHARTMRE
jgi:SAM-dependent methyltransferase